MEKILVSACLLGEKVRYDGTARPLKSSLFAQWHSEGRLVTVCPEMAGGLPTPRAPAERRLNRVILKTGTDVTQEFRAGAEAALNLCSVHGIKIAILKSNSPSCGNGEIYDGTFSGKKMNGEGFTCELLRKNGIQVFNENQILDVANLLTKLDATPGASSRGQ